MTRSRGSRRTSKAARPGYEYWGRRPPKMGSPGRQTKTLTHRLERRAAKKEESDE